VSLDDTETQTPILPLIILTNIVEDSSKEKDMLDECESIDIHQDHHNGFCTPTVQSRHFVSLVDDLCYSGPWLSSSVLAPNVRSVQLDGEMPHPRKHVKFRKPSSSNDMIENGKEVQASLSAMTSQCHQTTEDSKPSDSDLACSIAIDQISNDFGIQSATSDTYELGEVNVNHDSIDNAPAITELISLFYQLEWQRNLHFIMAQSGWKLNLVEATNYSSLCSQHPDDGLQLLCSHRKHVKFRNKFALAIHPNDTSVNSVSTGNVNTAIHLPETHSTGP
jgi:hypothetical protein